MDGHAADAKRAYCNTKGSSGAPWTCKNQFSFPLIHTKTYPRPVLHFRASAIPNEIVLTSIIRTPSASTADSATPVFFSSSKSTLSFRRFCPLCKGNLGGVPFLDYYVIMDRLFNPFTYITINIFLILFYILIGIHTGRVLCE